MDKVFLNGIALQVNTSGLRPYQTTVVDDGQPWLARDKVIGLRFGDDAQAFEVQTLSGKRHRLAYVNAAPSVPTNNDANLGKIYRKAIQTAYELTGVGLSKDLAQYIYKIYAVTQKLWAQKAQLAAQLNDPDISKTTRDALVASYDAISFTPVTLSLVAPGLSASVFFAEGSSCQFTDWVIADYTDFQFQLISRTYV